MSKLAAYEKRYGKQDEKINSYFQHDYVYIKNFWTRVYVVIGSIIVILFQYLHRIVVDDLDILSLDIKAELIRAGAILVVVAVFYTAIGTLRESMEYSRMQRRINKYLSLINQLDIIRKKAEGDTEEAAYRNGANSVYSRKFN